MSSQGADDAYRGPIEIVEIDDPDLLRRWPLLPGESLAAGPAEECVDTYYDTRDARFHRAGLWLRVREGRGGIVAATMPRGAPGAAVLARANARLPRHDRAALSACPGLLGERVRALRGGRALVRVVVLRSRCETFALRRDGTPVAAIRLESPRLPWTAERPLRHALVEVEAPDLRDATVARLLEALRSRRTPVSLEGGSLGEAIAAFGGLPGGPDLGPTVVDAGQTASEAAFAVLRRHVVAWLIREPGTRLGEDPEELHRMRTSLRRTRATLRLFRRCLPSRVSSMAKRIAWLGRTLGPVRDLDVQIVQLADARRVLPPEDRIALVPLRARIEEERRRARDAMLRALDSRRYTRLVSDLSALLRAGPSDAPPEGLAPVSTLAPRLLGVRLRRLRRQVRKLKASSAADAFHQARIRAKEVRYALEALGPLYGDAAEAPMRAAARIQSHLGEHQDACVAMERLEGIVRETPSVLPSRTLYVVGRLAERCSGRMRQLRAEAPRLLSKIRGKRWKNLRRAMEESGQGAVLPPPVAPAAEPGPAPASNDKSRGVA